LAFSFGAPTSSLEVELGEVAVAHVSRFALATLALALAGLAWRVARPLAHRMIPGSAR
jgi:hypothetical protein